MIDKIPGDYFIHRRDAGRITHSGKSYTDINGEFYDILECNICEAEFYVNELNFPEWYEDLQDLERPYYPDVNENA